MSARLLAQFRTSSWQITTSGGGVLTLPDDDYYLSAAPSLLTALTVLTGWVWAVDTAGRVTVGTGVATGTWSDSRLSDALGFVAGGVIPAGNSTAPQASPYRLDLSHSAEEDVEEPESLATVARSDTSQWVESWGSRDWRVLRLILTGHDRGGDADTEYWRARRFWTAALAPGLVFRWYPDDTVTAAFNATTAPLGFQIYTCDTRAWPFQPVAAGLHTYWRGSLRLHPAAEA